MPHLDTVVTENVDQSNLKTLGSTCPAFAQWWVRLIISTRIAAAQAQVGFVTGGLSAGGGPLASWHRRTY
jgi:Na+/glutamate symporter